MERNPESVALVSRVSKIEGQVSALTDTVNNFVQASEVWRRDFASEMRLLATNFTDRTQPNTTVMFAIIVGVCAFFFTREMGRSHEDYVNLDMKLQREFQLMVNNAEQKYQEADKNSKERHENMVKTTDELNQWQRDRDKEDRQELMLYRTQKLNAPILPQSSNMKPNNRIAQP